MLTKAFTAYKKSSENAWKFMAHTEEHFKIFSALDALSNA